MSASAGRSGRRWQRLKAEVYARRGPCCRCGQPIDYTLPYLDVDTGAANLASKSVDHYPHPRVTHPHLAEEPSNLAAAHLGCNLNAGDRVGEAVGAGLGQPSTDW